MINFDAKGFVKDMAISVTTARKTVQVQTLDRLLKDESISKENYDKHLAIVMQEFSKSVDVALGFKG